MSTELETPDAGLNAEPVIPTETTETTVEPTGNDTLDSIAKLAERNDESVPLRKYMDEKKARKEVETRAKELEAEIEALRNKPKGLEKTVYDVKALSDKHGIDEEVLSDILNASYTMNSEKIRKELENELSPKLAKLDEIENANKTNDFNVKFESIIAETLNELPEYANIIDKNDLRDWVLSGKYSKLSMAQLVEQKYGKFVQGKKTLETSNPSKEATQVDISNLTDEDWNRMNNDPELRKKYSENFGDRLKSLLQ